MNDTPSANAESSLAPQSTPISKTLTFDPSALTNLKNKARQQTAKLNNTGAIASVNASNDVTRNSCDSFLETERMAEEMVRESIITDSEVKQDELRDKKQDSARA